MWLSKQEQKILDLYISFQEDIYTICKWHDILKELLPKKSVNLCLLAWSKLLKHAKKEQKDLNEDDYLNYFKFLKDEQKLSGPSLWCTFSKLNAVNVALNGVKLQKDIPE